jgi:hypothetical protein
MRFYTQSHRYYCGIDLHARWMYLCILDPQGEVLLHRNLRAGPEAFLKAVEPYRRDLVVAVECIFSWYWLADLCAQEGIEFIFPRTCQGCPRVLFAPFGASARLRSSKVPRRFR